MKYKERSSRTAAVGRWQDQFPDGLVKLPWPRMITRQVLAFAPDSASPSGYSWASIKIVLELHYGWHSFEDDCAVKGKAIE